MEHLTIEVSKGFVQWTDSDNVQENQYFIADRAECKPIELMCFNASQIDDVETQIMVFEGDALYTVNNDCLVYRGNLSRHKFRFANLRYVKVASITVEITE